MTKITPDHLARSAYVYIRQSTADQLLHNAESRRRQYALQERARHLGWADVVVIDHDLGRSGSGVSRLGSSVCSPPFVRAVWVPCSRSRRRGSPATVAIGTR